MTENRIGTRHRALCAVVLLAALALPRDSALAAPPAVDLGVPAGTAAETATPTATEAPATPTRFPVSTLIENGGCAIGAAPSAAPLPLLAAALALWLRRTRRRG